MKNSRKYLIITIITFISGYLFFKLGYSKTSDTPFAQEILLLVFGTIATIAITAALLNKQSEAELEKEQRVKVFDIKTELYFELISFIENIIKKEKITPLDLISLEYLTHKISIIAAPEVLKEYATFVEVVKNASTDSIISPIESNELSERLSHLCYEIRYDLLIKKNKNNINTEELIKSKINNF